MIRVPFLKYTSYGNNFVIVDETENAVLTEDQKSQFAHRATNTQFGIGCDNLLVIQRCTETTLEEINRERGYWNIPPRASSADFIFRMFEPNGDEAFSCGNGLLSIANHLHRRYKLSAARVMTEVPFMEPRVIELAVDAARGTSAVNLGRPRRIPESGAALSIRQPVDESVDLIDCIEIRFREEDRHMYTEHPALRMSAYMVFTGEPHLVVFPEESFSLPGLAKRVFTGPGNHTGAAGVRRRVSLGSWLMRRVGVFLNDQLRGYFPAGINVNMARVVPESGQIEYRCFERGIFRETLACGTGAVAVAVVARHTGRTSRDEVEVLPHVCRWHDTAASMTVTARHSGEWQLTGSPRRLLEGAFDMYEAHVDNDDARDGGVDTAELMHLESSLLDAPLAAGVR